MICDLCEESLRVTSANNKKEKWKCRKAACGYKEEVKLWGPPVAVEAYELVEREFRECVGLEVDEVEEGEESVVDFIAQLDEDERRSEMAKRTAGLAGAKTMTKEEKKAAMKAKAEAKKAAKAKEAEEFTKARATKTKGKKAAVKDKPEPADCPKCPCCGERTSNPNSYFQMGHDGRVKGWFTKKAKGKLPDEVEFSAELEKMYKIWKKDDGMTIKEIVKKVRGIKD